MNDNEMDRLREANPDLPEGFDDPKVMSGGARAAVRSIKRSIHIQTAWIAIMTLILVGGVAYAVITQQKIHDALCNLRQDRINETNASRRFLIKHPNGLPQAGISAAVIQQGIDRNQITIDSLSALHCAGQ